MKMGLLTIEIERGRRICSETCEQGVVSAAPLFFIFFCLIFNGNGSKKSMTFACGIGDEQG